mgnify:CR=1 FL=1
MYNQARGTYHEDSGRMSRYDQLPAEVREIVRNAIHIMAPTPRLEALRRGADAAAVMNELVHTDVAASRKDALADWGKQASDYIAAQRPRRRRDWLDKPARSRGRKTSTTDTSATS